MSQRAGLLRAVQAARTGQELGDAVAALDRFDQERTAAAARSRELDMSARLVREPMTPVPLFERHTAATDWLMDYEAPTDYRPAMITAASQWFGTVGREVLADREEFHEQALGQAYTAASTYGDGDVALQARRTFMQYVGFLRQGASGLPQIDQTVDPNNQESATPYPTDVFDNFAPEQDPANTQVESPNHASQIGSEQAPMLQQINQMNSSGSGFGSGPERPDQHDTSFDQSLSYAEVPLGPPGTIQTAGPGQMPSQPGSAPTPAIGQPQDQGAQQRAASLRKASYTEPDHEGFRWKLAAADDGGTDVDPWDTPFHVRCSGYHYPDQACSRGGQHTASVAVDYLGDLDGMREQLRYMVAGAREGVAVLAGSGGDMRRVAAHHDRIVLGFRMQARTEPEIAWLRGYMTSVRPVLAQGFQACACGSPARPGKKTCEACKGKKTASRRRLDFPLAAEAALPKGAPFAGYEDFEDCTSQNSDKRDPDAYCGEIKHRTEDKGKTAASNLPQVQQTVDPHDQPTPQADQLPEDVMFPLVPAFGGGGGDGTPGPAKEARRSMQPSASAVRLFGRMDAMEGRQPHHKSSYPFSAKAHGAYLRAWNETAGTIHGRSGRGPVGATQYAEWTGRPDLHKHYLGAFYNAGGSTPDDSGWDSGADASRNPPVISRLAAIMTRPRSSWTQAELRFVADFMTRPHQSTDDQNPPFDRPQTSPDPWSQNEQGSDYQQGVRDGQEDRRGGEAPTFSDNSSHVSPYVAGYAVGYHNGPSGSAPTDVPRSMGGDSGQAANAQQAATSFQVSKASLQRTAACIGCGHMSHLDQPCPEWGCTDKHYQNEMGGGRGSHAIAIPSGYEKDPGSYRVRPRTRSWQNFSRDDDYEGSGNAPYDNGYASNFGQYEGRMQRRAHEDDDDYEGSGNQHDDNGYASDYGRYDEHGRDIDPGGRHAGARRTARDFSQAERERAEAEGDTVPGTTKLPVKNRQDLANAERLKGKVTGVSPVKVDAYIERKEHEFGREGFRISAAFVTRQAAGNADFRKGYGYVRQWRAGQRLPSTGSAAFEAGLYSGICDRPRAQAAWIVAHRRLAARHPQLRERMQAHASFTRKLVDGDGRFRTAGNRCYPAPRARQAATSTDLITDGPGTSPDPMGSTPLNGPGTPPPMAGGEDPARSGGPPPYQMVNPVGHGPVAPDDVMGNPQEPPQHSGPFTQTYSGRHPENVTLAPVAPNDAAGRGYENAEAYQGDPQRMQHFRAKVQASLAARQVG